MQAVASAYESNKQLVGSQSAYSLLRSLSPTEVIERQKNKQAKHKKQLMSKSRSDRHMSIGGGSPRFEDVIKGSTQQYIFRDGKPAAKNLVGRQDITSPTTEKKVTDRPENRTENQPTSLTQKMQSLVGTPRTHGGNQSTAMITKHKIVVKSPTTISIKNIHASSKGERRHRDTCKVSQTAHSGNTSLGFSPRKLLKQHQPIRGVAAKKTSVQALKSPTQRNEAPSFTLSKTSKATSPAASQMKRNGQTTTAINLQAKRTSTFNQLNKMLQQT